MSVDNDTDASKKGIDDKYSAPTSSIPASDADDKDKRDTRTKGRESFLNIYKENEDGDQDQDNDDPDLSNGIRFKRDENENEPDFELKTGGERSDGKKPLI